MEIIQEASLLFGSCDSYYAEQACLCAHDGSKPVCSCDNKQQKPQCVWDY